MPGGRHWKCGTKAEAMRIAKALKAGLPVRVPDEQWCEL
jgi:hypothetical protein